MKKNFFARFFLTYISVAVPVLLASVFATNVILHETVKMETQMLQTQLEDAEREFVENYQGYYNESVLIASRPELLPYKMLEHPRSTYDGIEILRLKQSFDDSIFSVFVTYENEYVYSSSGTARKEVYFTNVLECESESRLRGISAVESEENAVTLLYGIQQVGRILYSYKIYRSGEPLMSVNFVIPVEEMDEIFALSYPEQYYELTMRDGSSLVFGRDEKGNMEVMDADQWQLRAEEREYQVLDGVTGEQGITLKLYYDKMSFSVSKWLYRVQLINILLILLGVTLSAVFSWLLSHKQLREITVLESAARGEYEQSLSAKNAYHSLQNLILQGVYENQKLEELVTEHKEKLEDKLAYMIFHGLFREPEALEVAFSELGVSVPERFFVGAVSTAETLPASLVNEILQKKVWTSMAHGEKRIIVFLYGLNNEDDDQLLRKQAAKEIRAELHRAGMSRVRIGMSQLYANSILIDSACTEAVRTLDDILDEKVKDYCACWDSRSQKQKGVLPDDSMMERFDEAMLKKDYDEALECFQSLLYSSSAKECTPQNRTYYRDMILQHVASFLQKEEGSEAAVLLEECININVEQEREFTGSVIRILQKSLSKKEDGSFARILNYISRNYQNSNLTYEEVAEAGGIGKTYISKLFRINLGMSYIEYLTWIRLDKACTLLRTTDLNISAIAEMVGYANAASFRRAFKEKYGISASDYRKKEKEES